MKTEKANLESKRILFFSLGLLVATSIVFTALSWKSYEKHEYKFANLDFDTIDYDTMMVLQPPKPKLPSQKTNSLENPARLEKVQEKLLEFDSDEEKKKTTSGEDTTDFGDDDEPLEDVSDVNPYAGQTVDYALLDVVPSFRYSNGGLAQYINEFLNLNDLYLPSKIKVKFRLDKNGKVKEVAFKTRISKTAEHRIKFVLKRMPNWSPAQKGGFKVGVWCELPLVIRQ